MVTTQAAQQERLPRQSLFVTYIRSIRLALKAALEII
jgi:hypothetical protein